MKIYTRSGDKGFTSIHGGERVSKTDIRIETNGCLDELNVAIGILRSSISEDHPWQSMLRDMQLNIMSIMSLVATRNAMRSKNPNVIPSDIVVRTEQLIDSFSIECTPTENFILPGGTKTAAQLHQCRVLARRGERRLWSLNQYDAVPEEILRYFNRLSDLFFIMARWDIQHSGHEEEIWRKFGYKRKSGKECRE